MPRKLKTEKPPLQFLERTVGGARLRNVPEVRAALNPKEYFTDEQGHTSTLNSWVSPQFDTSVAAVPPLRRGRRKCLSTTSILDSCSQPSRKTTVCKFPSLTFQTRSRDQPHQAKSRHKKKAAECRAVSDAGNQPQGSCRAARTVSSAPCSDTPKRKTTSIRKRNEERFSDVAASSSERKDQPETPSSQVTEKRRTAADGVSTPTANEVSGVDPPPDVDTPNAIQEASSGSSSTCLHLLLPQSCTHVCNQPPDILVADTPERDYGVKVTWRRRRGLMLLLKGRGHLSDSDNSQLR